MSLSMTTSSAKLNLLLLDDKNSRFLLKTIAERRVSLAAMSFYTIHDRHLITASFNLFCSMAISYCRHCYVRRIKTICLGVRRGVTVLIKQAMKAALVGRPPQSILSPLIVDKSAGRSISSMFVYVGGLKRMKIAVSDFAL
eukprot:scaffold182372_cov15-Prasinocladus_malaysianus.AAC.1